MLTNKFKDVIYVSTVQLWNVVRYSVLENNEHSLSFFRTFITYAKFMILKIYIKKLMDVNITEFIFDL